MGDLRELFGKFYTLTGPNGKVLASVLNPYFVGDMKFPWWWRRVPRLWRDGHYSLPSPEGLVARRRLAEFAALSSALLHTDARFSWIAGIRIASPAWCGRDSRRPAVVVPLGHLPVHISPVR